MQTTPYFFTYIITISSLSGGTQWGFGQVWSSDASNAGLSANVLQVLALAVVIPSVIALVRAIRKNRIAKLKKEKEQREDEVMSILG